MSNFKNPPQFNPESMKYETWKNELDIWRLMTEIPLEKQALAVTLSLKDKAKDAALQIRAADLNKDTGLATLITKLDSMFLKEEKDRAYEAYQNFEIFHRSGEMNMSDYITEFEQRYCAFNLFAMTLPDAVLAFKLLDNAGLNVTEKQLALTACTDLTFASMKSALRRIFGGNVGCKLAGCAGIELKQESVYVSQDRKTGFKFDKRDTPKGTNPLNKFGKRTKCAICQSIFHWAKDCPEKAASVRVTNDVSMPCDTLEYCNITLFNKEELTDNEIYVVESRETAIIDTACTRTVCGDVWLNDYISSLSEKDKNNVFFFNSNKAFKFGDGKVIHSFKRAIIPATIGNTNCNIGTEVVKNNIPLLLSKSSLKKAGTKLDLEKDKAIMFNEAVNLEFTSSGHYCVNIIPIKKSNALAYSEIEQVLTITDDMTADKKRSKKQLIEESEQGQLFQKENKHLANGWKNLTDEKDLVKEQLKQCEQTLAQAQSHVLSLALQKDTLQHQLKETDIRNKQLKNDKDSLNQDNFRLQNQLSALQHEITTDKLTISNLEENKRKLEEEFCAVKKVCEELSGELCSVKCSYEQALEQVGDLKKESSHFTQKCHTLEQKKKQLEQNITQMKENLKEKKKYYRSEKKHFEDTTRQLKDEIKYSNQIRVQQKDKCTALEQKLQKTVNELPASSTVQREELAGWKNTCERLTGALNQKEKEIQSLADKCGDLEEVTLQLKVEVHDYKDQSSNIHRLKEENRRLLQEKQENEQMIQLLETEKEVLSINAKRDLDNCQRELSKMELDMDSQKQIVADLQQTNEFLAEKVDLCEKENEELKEAFCKEAEISTDEQKGLKITYDVLYDEHIQLKKEYRNLLERHECFMSNFNNDSTIPNKDLNVISKEKEGLERQIDLLNGQISLIEGSKKRSEETVKKMEEELMKIKTENESLKTNCQNETLTHDGEPHAYQTELDRIKEELQETKLELQKQQESYKLLKQESLADVDHDLQQMRQELHKLMGVIEIKDQEIENLSKQLKIAQTQLYNQEETMKQMKETIQQIEKKAASNLSSEMAAPAASSNDGIISKQNGDHTDVQPLEQITHQFPGVTLRSASMVESLSSVDETVKFADAPSLPNDERLQSLIAKYRNPSDPSSSPEKNRIVGRPHSVGPGSTFSGMSRILGLTTPKPFYLSSAGSKFNRFSGTSLGSGISTINPPAANASTVSTTISSVPLSTDASAVSLSSQSSTFSSSLNTNEDVPKTSPVKVGVSNRPPVPPPRPASRPSSAHIPDVESPVNGVMSPPSPATTADSTVVDASEEVEANMIITI